MRLSATNGGYRINVLTAPRPFRAGAVDTSTLVQDAKTEEPMTQVQLTVHMIKEGGLALEYPATADAAPNKVFRLAQFELLRPGRWQMQVLVGTSHGPMVLPCEVDVAELLPRWLETWPWIGWPAIAIVFFGIHEVLGRQRRDQGGPRLLGR